jgi:hypothetical protein
MQLAMTVGAVVIGGLIVVGIVGFLFEKYADNVDSHGPADATPGQKSKTRPTTVT